MKHKSLQVNSAIGFGTTGASGMGEMDGNSDPNAEVVNMVRVLLVDEDDKFCEDLSLRLNGRGYGLVRESTILEGIRSICEIEPTVLLAGLTSSGGSANSLLDASCKSGVALRSSSAACRSSVVRSVSVERSASGL